MRSKGHSRASDPGEAVAALQANRPDQALRALKPLLKRDPSNAVLNDLAGVAHLMSGRPAPALRFFRQATRGAPDRPGFWRHLAEAGRAAGEFGAAIEAYRKSLELEEDGSARLGLADALDQGGALDEAIAAFAALVEAQPAEHGLALRLANLQARRGAVDAAAATLESVIAVDPDNAAAHNNLGVVLGAVGSHASAVSAAERACRLAPQNSEYHRNHGLALTRAKCFDAAAEAYQRASELAPEDGRAGAALASLEERRNRLSAAESAAQAVLRVSPKDPEARLVLARIGRRRGAFDAALEALRPIGGLDRLPVALAASIASERGFINDRAGRTEAAIESFRQANALHDGGDEATGIDRQAFFRSIAAERAFAETARYDQWPDRIDDGCEDPIFLVGFPRSGTTLTEQILAARDDLAATDEEPVLLREIGRLGESGAYPRCLSALDDAAVRALRWRYFDGMEAAVGSLVGRRLLDKLPLNLAHLSAIRRLFPQARLIMALRDPRDVVLSNWMQNFDLNEAMIQALDITTAARAYAAVMDLWLFQRDRVGLARLEHRYEEMVSDVETAVRRLTEFLGLDWDASILKFDGSARGRVISTPSARDVASGGVFDRAKGRWRRYETLLAPATPHLAPYVKAFGYEPDDEPADADDS